MLKNRGGSAEIFHKNRQFFRLYLKNCKIVLIISQQYGIVQRNRWKAKLCHLGMTGGQNDLKRQNFLVFYSTECIKT